MVGELDKDSNKISKERYTKNLTSKKNIPKTKTIDLEQKTE